MARNRQPEIYPNDIPIPELGSAALPVPGTRAEPQGKFRASTYERLQKQGAVSPYADPPQYSGDMELSDSARAIGVGTMDIVSSLAGALELAGVAEPGALSKGLEKYRDEVVANMSPAAEANLKREWMSLQKDGVLRNPKSIYLQLLRVLPSVASSMVGGAAAGGAAARMAARTMMPKAVPAVAGATGAALTEAPQIAGATLNEIRQTMDSMSAEELREFSPQFRKAMDKYGDEAEARREVLMEAARAPAYRQAVWGALVAAVPGAAIGGRMGGQAAAKTQRRLAAEGFAMEGAEEVAQEVPNQVDINVAVREAIDTRRNIDEGVGEAAVSSFFLGGGAGAVVNPLLGGGRKSKEHGPAEQAAAAVAVEDETPPVPEGPTPDEAPAGPQYDPFDQDEQWPPLRPAPPRRGPAQPAAPGALLPEPALSAQYDLSQEIPGMAPPGPAPAADGPDRTPNLPEPREDILAQLEHMMDVNTKKVTMYIDPETVEAFGGTPGQLLPARALPRGVRQAVDKDGGLALSKSKERLDAYVGSEQDDRARAEFLGYTTTKEDLRDPENSVVVQQLNKDGYVVNSQVSDSDPKSVSQTIKAMMDSPNDRFEVVDGNAAREERWQRYMADKVGFWKDTDEPGVFKETQDPIPTDSQMALPLADLPYAQARTREAATPPVEQSILEGSGSRVDGTSGELLAYASWLQGNRRTKPNAITDDRPVEAGTERQPGESKAQRRSRVLTQEIAREQRRLEQESIAAAEQEAAEEETRGGRIDPRDTSLFRELAAKLREPGQQVDAFIRDAVLNPPEGAANTNPREILEEVNQQLGGKPGEVGRVQAFVRGEPVSTQVEEAERPGSAADRRGMRANPRATKERPKTTGKQQEFTGENWKSDSPERKAAKAAKAKEAAARRKAKKEAEKAAGQPEPYMSPVAAQREKARNLATALERETREQRAKRISAERHARAAEIPDEQRPSLTPGELERLIAEQEAEMALDEKGEVAADEALGGATTVPLDGQTAAAQTSLEADFGGRATGRVARGELVEEEPQTTGAAPKVKPPKRRATPKPKQEVPDAVTQLVEQAKQSSEPNEVPSDDPTGEADLGGAPQRPDPVRAVTPAGGYPRGPATEGTGNPVYAGLSDLQRDGTNTLVANFKRNADSSAAILADGAGTGKTGTMLATINEFRTWFRETRGREPKVLVVAPKVGILNNFVKDARKLFPPGTFQNPVDGAVVRGKERLPSIDGVELLTYQRLLNHATSGYDLVVLDEAHTISQENKFTAAVRSLDAAHSIFATATPADKAGALEFVAMLEDRSAESLLDAIIPGKWSRGDGGYQVDPASEEQFHARMGAHVQKLADNYQYVRAYRPLEAKPVDLALEESDLDLGYELTASDGSKVSIRRLYNAVASRRGAGKSADSKFLTLSTRLSEYAKLRAVEAEIDEAMQAQEQSVVLFGISDSTKAATFTLGEGADGRPVTVKIPPAKDVLEARLKEKYGDTVVNVSRSRGVAKAVTDFQSGAKKILLGTYESVGEGVDLDAQVSREAGGWGRRALLLSYPWEASKLEQALHRFERAGTRILPTTKILHADYFVSDAARRQSQARRDKLLAAMQNREYAHVEDTQTYSLRGNMDGDNYGLRIRAPSGSLEHKFLTQLAGALKLRKYSAPDKSVYYLVPKEQLPRVQETIAQGMAAIETEKAPAVESDSTPAPAPKQTKAEKAKATSKKRTAKPKAKKDAYADMDVPALSKALEDAEQKLSGMNPGDPEYDGQAELVMRLYGLIEDRASTPTKADEFEAAVPNPGDPLSAEVEKLRMLAAEKDTSEIETNLEALEKELDRATPGTKQYDALERSIGALYNVLESRVEIARTYGAEAIDTTIQQLEAAVEQNPTDDAKFMLAQFRAVKNSPDRELLQRLSGRRSRTEADDIVASAVEGNALQSPEGVRNLLRVLAKHHYDAGRTTRARLYELMARAMEQTDIRLTSTERFAGRYDPSEDRIYLNARGLIGVAEDTFVHEALHAVTSWAIQKSPAVRKHLQMMRNEALRIFAERGRSMDPALAAELDNALNPKDENGRPIPDVELDEFLAHGLTNPRIFEFLEGVEAVQDPAEDNKGMFRRLWDRMLRWLGVKNVAQRRRMSEELMEVAQRATTRSRLRGDSERTLYQNIGATASTMAQPFVDWAQRQRTAEPGASDIRRVIREMGHGVSTLLQIEKNYRELLNQLPEGNPVREWLDAMHRKEVVTNVLQKLGTNMARAYQEAVAADNGVHREAIEFTIGESTLYEIWPNHPFKSEKNKHLWDGKSAGEVARNKERHARLQTAYNSSPVVSEIWNRLQRYYETERKENFRLRLANIIKGFELTGARVRSTEVTPTGATIRAYEALTNKQLLESLLDRKKYKDIVNNLEVQFEEGGTYSPDERISEQLRSALRDDIGTTLANGPYFPLKRFGEWAISAYRNEGSVTVTLDDETKTKLSEKALKAAAKRLGLKPLEVSENVPLHKEILRQERAKSFERSLRIRARDAAEAKADVDTSLEIDTAEVDIDNATATTKYRERWFSLHENPGYARQARDELRAQGWELPDTIQRKPLQLVRAMGGSNSQLINTLRSRLGDTAPQLLASLEASLIDMMPETAVRKEALQRKGILGASNDHGRALAAHVQSAAWYRGTLQEGLKISEANRKINDVDRNAGQYVDTQADVDRIQGVMREIKRHIQMDANSAGLPTWIRATSSFGFIWMLLSPVYVMVNLTQPGLYTLPWLRARQGQGPLSAGSALMRASRLIGGEVAGRAWTAAKQIPSKLEVDPTLFDFLEFDEGGNPRITEAVHKRLRDAARNNTGLISGATESERMQRAEDLATMLLKLSEENVLDFSLALDTTAMAEGRESSRLAQRTMDMARVFPHLTEVMNRATTAIAAYEVARENRGDSDEQAYQFAKEAVNETQFNYTLLNKPRFMSERSFSLAKPLFMFMQHPQHVYAMFVQSMVFSHRATRKIKAARDAGNFDPKNNPEHAQWLQDAKENRDTVLGLLTTHLAAAGVTGAMFEPVKMALGLTLLVFEQATGEPPEETDTYIRRWVNGVFGNDLGQVVTDGLPELLGVHLSDNLGIDQLLFGMGGNRAGALSSPDAARDSFIGMLGPLPNFVFTNGVGGLQDMRQGDVLGGVSKLSPRLIRGPLRALKEGQYGLLDSNGHPILNADEMSPVELAMTALGFTTADKAMAYANKSAIDKRKLWLQSQRKRFSERLYRARFSPQKTAEVRREIEELNAGLPPEARIPTTVSASKLRSARALERYGAVLDKSERWLAEEAGILQ